MSETELNSDTNTKCTTSMQSNTIVNETEQSNQTRSREEIVQQRKLKVKIRKLEKKAAMKLKKEDENFKLRIMSKYQGITLINMEESVSETVRNSKEDISVPHLSEFPSLGSSGNKKKIFRPNVEVTVEEIIKKGKPRKSDPISINLFDVIVDKKKKKKTPVSMLKSSRTHIRMSGNILDSDNPQRKRGKVRPGKKPKVSRLKAYILKSRQEKKNIQNCASTNLMKTKQINLATNEATNCQFSVNLKDCKHPESERRNASEENDSSTRVIHSRRFREYCENVISPPLVESVCSLLSTIVKFQDRLFIRDPIKAHAKRRYVVGLREAGKYLKLGKVQLLIIAPDLEKLPGENGLDNAVLHLKEEAQRKFVPYIFGPNRAKLGYCTFRKQKVSAVAILRHEGAEEQFNQVMALLNEARMKYKTLTESQPEDLEKIISNEKIADVNTDEIIPLFLQKLMIKDKEECESEEKATT